MSSPFQQRFSKSSPLKQGAYESAADNAVYLSTQPAMQAMQNAITEVGVAAIKAAGDPANKAERQDKRVKRRGERTDARDKKLGANDALPKDHKDKWSDKKRAQYTKRTDHMAKITVGVAEKSANNKIKAKEKKKIPKFSITTGKRNHDPNTGLPIE